MDNETRRKIQLVENKLSELNSLLREVKELAQRNERDIIEVKSNTRANSIEIQILKDGGNI